MKKNHILIVEDEALIALEIKERLERLGYGTAGIVFTGAEAIKEAIESKPDLILMDIQLRDNIDGVEAATEIHRHSDIPVIYLTAYGDKDILDRAKVTEPYGYLIKPINELELRCAIEMALYKHKAEHKIRENEEKFRTLFNKASDVIFIFDLEGNIQEINQQAVDRLGYSRQELCAMNISDIYPCELSDNLCQYIEVIRKKGHSVVETSQRHRDGKTIPTETSCSLIMYCDEEAILCFARDITSRKKIQEELFKMEKLKSIATFAGGIAHDFNNLLTAILGNISLAEISIEPDSRMQMLMDEAERACYRAKNLTDQLLTFAHGGEGDKSIIVINKLIENTVHLTLSGSHVKCQFHFSDSLYPIYCDTNQIQKLINHLVNNARESMPYGGTIEVKTENIHLDKETVMPLDEGDYVKISIKDSGWGISKNDISKVFDPYFSSKERGTQKGMGLGLAIVYSIIKDHNGHIIVSSEPGIGTTIHIFLPTSLNTREEEQAHYASFVRESRKILFMDDEDLVRKVTGKMLEHIGYEITLCQDAEEALALFSEAKESGHPFDLVILDLTIQGGIGGKEVIKQLKAIDPYIRAIITSGYSNDSILSTFHSYGFSSAIVKPFTLNKLKKTIDDVLL